MPIFTITKEFHFSCSHRLVGLEEGHQCSRLHGHNYVLRVILQGGLDDRGFVLDYGDLAPLKRFIDERVDHRHILSEKEKAEWFAAHIGEYLVRDEIPPDALAWHPYALSPHHFWVPGIPQSSAEHLAEYFLGWCRRQDWPVVGVEVKETPKTSAVAEISVAESWSPEGSQAPPESSGR